MAAAKTNHPTIGIQYTVVDAHGNTATLQQSAPQARGTRFLQLAVNGLQVTMSQQNAADLTAAITAFGLTGVLT